MPPSAEAVASALASADARDPAAGDLARLLSFLASDPLPLEPLRGAAAHLPDALSSALAEDGGRAAGTLLLASELAEGDAGAPVMPLPLREAVRATMDDEARRRWAATAAALMTALFPPQPEGEAARAVPLVRHAAVAALHCEELEVAMEDAAALFGLAGRTLLVLRRSADARPFLERALELRERTLGPDAQAVAFDLTWLNGALLDEGDAEALNVARNAERALRIFEATDGPEGATTLVHVNNVGTLYRRAGDLPAARAFLERAVELAARIHGTEHAFYATIGSNLGDVLQDQGDPAAARPLYERALAVDERAYGKTNRSVARDLRKLASLLVRLDDPAAARPLLERLAAFFEGEGDEERAREVREEIESLPR